jgi:putative transposase
MNAGAANATFVVTRFIGYYKQWVHMNAGAANATFVVTRFIGSSFPWTITMYDYRRMSQEERRAIVEYRKSRGFPLHRPPHLDQGEGWYFITAATYEHRRHFSDPRELTALEQRLRETLVKFKLQCAGWVVFPNHYHLLLKAPDLRHVGLALAGVHGRSAIYANRRDKTPTRQVWCNYTDRKIRSAGHFWACLHYIVLNPVRHRYVETMEE